MVCQPHTDCGISGGNIPLRKQKRPLANIQAFIRALPSQKLGQACSTSTVPTRYKNKLIIKFMIHVGVL